MFCYVTIFVFLITYNAQNNNCVKKQYKYLIIVNVYIMDNVLTFGDEPAKQPESTQTEMKLVDVVITNENIALNVIVSFLNIAQKRGAFNIDESAKIWECIQKFVNAPAPADV